MISRSYIWLNGEFTREDQPVLTLDNRSFQYGDGFFETIHAFGTEAKYLNFHTNRIIKSLSLLGMKKPGFLTKDFLANEITRLLNKNRYFNSTRVRITFFRNDGGFYTPLDNSIGIAIQAKPLEYNFYDLNQKGLVVDLYTELRKPINYLSPLKSCNSQIYVMAGKFKQLSKLDDCILINDQNRVVEATSSNVFIVKGDKIFTPALDEGCVEGIMRQIVIGIARRNGFQVIDDGVIEVDFLNSADELFLTNAVKGIQWVVGLQQKRFFGLVSKRLSSELNRETFPNQFRAGFSG